MITVVVPVSPIKSHPDIAILDQTLASVRFHLPDAEIILTFDGTRPEQAHRDSDYQEFIRRMLWRADKVYGNICPYIFSVHQHQTGMLRAVIDEIRTPLILYVEQDTPLVTDEPINWDAITALIEDGTSNVVRLYHEGILQPAHEHMMHGNENEHFIRTSQWSQRPHIASVAYYRRILDTHFSANARSFIEDRMHGILHQAHVVDGIAGWLQHRVHIYNPGTNMKRSYHTDGRAGEPKYDDTQVF